ncbi:MAG TPA: hypothetical protein PL178_09605 [Prevotella sp.]|nr:hypothetical protein [Prevotella sp.]HRN20325.1 hypothetical protein [Prevotella sp.]
MKKFRFFSFASAVLLASAAGMVSCSSDSIEPTGGSGATGQVVKTQFAINIPYGGNSSTNQAKKVTRMTDEMTQQSGKPFRGISDIVLLTFSGNPETAGTINADKPISIGTDGNAYSQDTYRRLYRDIEIPVGTSHMIFYGRATKKSNNTNFQAGKITDKGEKKTLANISHELTAISSEANFTTDVDAKAIITALNNIANAKVTDDDGTDYTWANIGNVSPLPTWLTAHEKEFLKTRYNKFTALKAGSKASVVAFINNLKTALAGETTTGEPISADKKLTKEIYNQCVAALGAIESINFPGKFNLPDGVASLNWKTGESTFAYNAPETELFGNGNSIKYNKICYPAELSYFVSTKTMVSDKDMSNLSEFPSYTDWTKNTQSGWGEKTSFAEKAVENSTRTVGLKDPVQYSVAVLKSTVRCKAATLEDNAQVAGKANQQITVPEDGFPVTGILIGGQPASVDWKYEPAASETFENTIYDKEMNVSPMYAKYTSEVPTVGNYTLVFDNKSTDKKPVFVTIELENNSDKAFYGKDGIILKGAKFYLVGKLTPNATEGVTNPNSVDRVFVQDYVTTANFNITDLKSAYNCIPDLRTSGINVGLAVDLSWKTGITFDVEL